VPIESFLTRTEFWLYQTCLLLNWQVFRYPSRQLIKILLVIIVTGFE
jgi:hypothetical protein